MLHLPTEKQKRKYQKYLAPSEEIIYVTGISRRYFWLTFIFFFPLSIILIGLPHLLTVCRLKKEMLYILTNKRLVIKTGIFSINLASAPYHQVTHIVVKQNVFDRFLFNVGNLLIHTAGPTPIEVLLERIGSPILVKNKIEELTEKEKESHHQDYTFQRTLVNKI